MFVSRSFEVTLNFPALSLHNQGLFWIVAIQYSCR